MDYAEQMQVQSTSISWAEQLEGEELSGQHASWVQ